MRVWVLLVGVCLACDDAAPVAPPDIGDATLFPDFDRPDAFVPRDAGLPTGAACTDEAPCERGSCVHGICSVLCAQDRDCPPNADVCVPRGGAGRCTPSCAATADCAGEQVCAVSAPGRGFCVQPGVGAAGDACATREDCASWVCAEGACLGRCDAAPCPEGRICLPLHTQSVCVSSGPAPAEAPCADGPDCASGVCRGGRCSSACRPEGDCPDDRTCVAFEALALCERRCASSADCGATGRCDATRAGRLCATRGPGQAGAPCAATNECDSGRCLASGCAGRCEDGNCPEGQACVVDASGAICRTAGAAPAGADCATGDACASGVCGGGRCTAACTGGGACPVGSRCTRFADGAFCFFACATDGDCPDAAWCDVSFAEGPTCFWRGPGAADAACARNADCRSGRCADGRCLARCVDGECPVGRSCRDFGTAPLCSPSPLLEGAACEPSDRCGLGLECIAGRCLPDCGGGCPGQSSCHADRCHPRCAVDGDCRPGRVCNAFDGPAPFCQTRGVGLDDSACDASGECASGLCLAGRCRPRCADGACEDRQQCVAFGVGRWCLEAGDTPVGGACAEDAECGAGICLGRRCVQGCEGTPCPEGSVCTLARGGRFCVVGCDPFDGAGCAPAERCAPDGDTGAGQCVGPDDRAGIGEACDNLADCTATAYACLDAGDGPRCRAACPVMSGEGCPAEAVCAPAMPDATIGACVPAGVGADLSPCLSAADCASGWCIFDYEGGRCGRACEDDADCGAPARCADLARNPQAPFRSCASRCAEDADCPAGLACRRDIAGEGACY